jgi:lipoprotein-anchoring transpeptidase ErfK/SrfK
MRRNRWLKTLSVAGVALLSVTAMAACTTATSGGALNSVASTASASAAPNGTAPAPAAPSSAITIPTTTSSSTPPPPPPPPPPAAVTATPAADAQGVDPLAPISVVATGGTMDAVRVINAQGEEVPVAGTLAPDGLSWTTAPNELGYGKTYTITAAMKNVAGVANEATSSFTTLVPENKTAVSTFPTDGMTVGIAQPIAITFDEPIADRATAQKAITVTTTPEQPGGFRWINDQELRWRPAAFWQSGTTVAVTVDIYGKNLGGGVYGQQDSSFSFVIGRSMTAEIDDNTKTMTVMQDGQPINSIPVSLGSNKYPTYNGVHVVAEKYESKIMDSSTWGLTGTGAYRTEVGWATRISSSGEFVHAAPWSVDSQGYENVSHGCVNVSTDAAIWFYDTFIPGDPVTIKNTVGPNLEVWDGYGDFQLPFEEYIAAT